MRPQRFTRFILLMDGIQKCIQKLRLDRAADLGVKSVHVFWILHLWDHPEGLTATELATKSMVDRSLVSREIADLVKRGYVSLSECEGKRKYNSRITLTEQGVTLARHINTLAEEVRADVNAGITEEEMSLFYATLEKMHRNFLVAAEELKES